MTFLLCSSCKRHIKSDETSCPFCNADAADAASPPERVSGRTRSRIFFGTVIGVVASGLASCSDPGSVEPLYGVPCTDDECTGPAYDSGHGFDSAVDAQASTDGAPADSGEDLDAADADVDGSDAADAADD